METKLVDFYNGLQGLEAIRTWAFAVAHAEVLAQRLLAFEAAYADLARLHAEGKLGVGEADFSAENLERVRRICQLLQEGVNSQEARQAAPEIYALAEECLRALAREVEKSGGEP